MGKRNCREVGAVYENRAVLFLKDQGYQIIKQNFRCKQGEIDIIAKDREYLVFIEVKYRKNAYEGAALEAVTKQKQRRIIQTARYYLCHTLKCVQVPCRFDVVAFEGEEMIHIQNAFFTTI